MQTNGVPEKVTMDQSGANKAAMDEINASGETPIIVRQVKYLNNIARQDHRGSEASHQTDAQFQVISSRQVCTGRHRIDAYDSQRTAQDGGTRLNCA